jgi:uncharacterized SAM-binding protein YcdF (DUF218 family)
MTIVGVGRVLRAVVVWGLATIGLVVLVLVATPVVHWGVAALEIDAPLARADAIAILGGGVRKDGVLGDQTLRRLIYGLRLFRQGYAPVVILTGGNPLDPSSPESEAMARVASELGLLGPAFIVETRAARTVDQARAIADIARQRGFKSVILVTSPTHVYRAYQAMRKTGVDVVPGPADRRAADAPTRWPTLNPGSAALRLADAAALSYEYAALALYWWRGWI